MRGLIWLLPESSIGFDPPFKIPKTITVVESLPKTATVKTFRRM